MAHRMTPLAVLPVLGLVLAGCGNPTLSAGTVSKAAEDALEQQVGQRPTVKCPKDVDAKVGATTRCTLTADGLDGSYGVTVTVTSVEGDKAHFDVKVDDHPQS